MQPTTKMINLEQLAATYSNDGHSLFSPSGSAMWLVCSGSLIPNALAEDIGSEYAAKGTVAHTIAEDWLKSDARPSHYLGTKQFVPAGWWGYYVTVDEQMMDMVEASVKRCQLLPGEKFTERRVYFSHITPIPNQGGTMDFAALSGDVLYVVDHKFGVGIRVYAERNTQAMLYAIGLLREMGERASNVRRIVLVIHQPYLDHYDQWELTRDDLMEFAGYVRVRAKAAWRLDAPRTADPKACEFCKVKSTCAANVQMQMRLMAAKTAEAFGEQAVDEVQAFKSSLTDDLQPFKPEFVDPLTLDTAQLAALKPYRKMVEKWWKSAEHELLRRAAEGATVPGYKLVEGRSFRDWANVNKAACVLEENRVALGDIYKTTIVSPAEAEALLLDQGIKRKELPNLLDGLTKKPPGKPTLAPLSDKRQALVNLEGVAWGDISNDSDDTEEI